VPFTSTKPPQPPKDSVEESELIPEASANWFSLVTFEWVSPLLALGYARPLEAPDLWKLQDERGSAVIAERINASFDRRVAEAAEFNKRLANGEIKPGMRKLWWMLTPGSVEAKEKKWREVDGKKKASLLWAMNDSVKWWFWTSALLKIISDVAQTTSPLVVRVRL
jgi:hypothetical protein